MSGFIVVALVLAAVLAALALGAEDEADVAGPVPRRSAPGIVRAVEPESPPERQGAPPPQERSRATGCGSRTQVGDFYLSTMLGLYQRTWLMVVPLSYVPSTPAPLVVLLAHSKERAEDFVDYSGFRELADEHAFLIAAPTVPSHGWTTPEIEDHIQAVVRQTSNELCVNPERVFVVGHINGGHGAVRLSCADWSRGSAIHSARPGGSPTFRCAEPHPMMIFSGLESEFEPPAGGPGCNDGKKLSLADHEKMWRKRNGCRGERRVFFDKGEGTCWTWTCDATFVSCHLDGGHNWPGAPPRAADLLNCDGESAHFPMAEAMWTFFERL